MNNDSDNTSTVIEGLNREDMGHADAEPLLIPTLNTGEEPSYAGRLEIHTYHLPHDHAHVDLTREEYLPDEAALLYGISVEVVMHAIRQGELKARRIGHNIVGIPRAELIMWFKDRS